MVLSALSVSLYAADGKSRRVIVADSSGHTPLSSASVFNHDGRFIGTTRRDGGIGCASPADYPLTIRYMGYHEETIETAAVDTVFLRENFAELPEVSVEGKHRNVLHILAFVREYSTLSSYTDTVTMFREKIVDFMMPEDERSRFKGWRMPRILSTRSYYQFTDINGLDSVSDRCNHHFTWSDWIGVPPSVMMPGGLDLTGSRTDTIAGKYSPAEIWVKSGDRLTVDVDILADTIGRRWIPGITYFFNKSDNDFERFHLRVNSSNVAGGRVTPLDLTGYSFGIESRGRGRNMFRFNHHEQPFFVTTYAEVYIVDKEFISVKEARKWENSDLKADMDGVFDMIDVPGLQPATLALIERVNNIDSDKVRTDIKADRRLMSPYAGKNKANFGKRALSMLKQLTGITYYKSHKNFDNRWNDFRDNWKNRNQTEGDGK